MEENAFYLSGRRIVPDNRRYSILPTNWRFGPNLARKFLEGPQEISGALQLTLKNWNIRKIL